MKCLWWWRWRLTSVALRIIWIRLRGSSRTTVIVNELQTVMSALIHYSPADVPCGGLAYRRTYKHLYTWTCSGFSLTIKRYILEHEYVCVNVFATGWSDHPMWNQIDYIDLYDITNNSTFGQCNKNCLDRSRLIMFVCSLYVCSLYVCYVHICKFVLMCAWSRRRRQR